MQQSEIFARVKKVVAAVLKMSEADIADDANFIFDLGADSAQSVELIVALEKEFGISIDRKKALAMQTIGESAEFVGSLVS